MLIEISDTILNRNNITERDIRIEIALILYEKKIMTLDQASRFSFLDSFEFQKLIGDRKISIHYSEDDFEEDLKTIKKILQ